MSGDIGAIVVLQDELGPDRPRPLREEGNGRALRRAGIGNLTRPRHRQRRDRVLLLPGDMERHPAGHKIFNLGQARRELGYVRSGGHYLLEVVQHQQQLLRPMA